MVDKHPTLPSKDHFENAAEGAPARTPSKWYEGWFEGVDPEFAVIVRTFITITCVVLFLVVGCTMHSNTYDEARRNADVAYRKASVEVEKQELAVQSRESEAERKHELDLVERIDSLIETGHHPIAARCAVMGWNEGDHVCAYATNK